MKKKIYLSGGISGLSLEDATEWRNYLKEKLDDFEVFSPTDYYDTKHNYHQSEKEVMEFLLYNLRNSDFVIVLFNDPYSLGTAMEIMLAKELHIPVIGVLGYSNVYTRKDIIHPWLIECCMRIELSITDAIDYVKTYMIN